MSVGVIAGRIAGLGAFLGRAGIAISDEAMRAMMSISDDFSDELLQAMAGGDETLTRFLQQNEGAIVSAVDDAGQNGRHAVAGLRALASNPNALRSISQLQAAMDDVVTRAAAQGDDLAEILGDSRFRQQLINRYGDDVVTTLERNATSLQTRLTSASSALDNAASAAAPAAAPAASGLSFLDRMMLNRLKIGLGLTAGVAAAVVTEWKSGGAISSAAAGLTMDIARGLENIDPNLARAFREGGVDAIIFGADIADTPRTAAINYIAEVLEQNGQPDAAAGVRIGGVIMNPVTYADLMLTPEGERAEAFVARLETAGVSRDQIETYLASRPTQLAMIQENLGNVDLSAVLPGLRRAAERTRDAAAEAVETAQLSGQSLTNQFNQVVQDNNLHMFSSFAMFFAVVLGWIGNMLGQPEMGDNFRRAVVGQAAVSQFGDQFGLQPERGREPEAPRMSARDAVPSPT